ncbi:MAG: hypothetical protein DPW09_25360 [Anaerolineae bacterium]|nr:alkaline phosphatase family protein [Anaerolineales bacterium]MCQ3976770.1 hypothetical protein [Anaerolineae bacterium]
MPPKSAPKKSKPRRRKFASPKLLLIWLAILILEGSGVAAVSAYWIFTPGQEAAPAAAQLAPTHFQLPEATPASAPTATATQAVIYLPTPTKTPTPLPPTLTPTAVATQPPSVASAPQPTDTPAPPQIQHVIIISIDGLRPDALFAAEAPYLDTLIAQGAYSPNAQTVSLSITLPSHASMLSGMLPEKHGIVWGMPYIGWPGMNGPTLFSVAHDAGLTTAMVFGKEKMNYLVLPNSVDQRFGADMHDSDIKEHALEIIQAGLPHVLFLHFPDTDRVGHASGWMSPNQLQAIAFVDNLIGEILAALESGGYLNTTLLIVTADHGGHGFNHGDDSPEDRTIPWLAVGPGVRVGVTLTRPINTYDTAATTLQALKLPIPPNWDGKPVLEIFK